MKMTEEKFMTYFNPVTIANCQHYLKVLLDVYLKMIHETHEPEVDSEQKRDAQILLQMFFTKGLAVYRLLNGLPYECGGVKLNPIVDHTTLFMLARNLCEYYTTYALVHILPNTQDKHVIMECLFESSGYKYRQRLFSPKMQEAHKEQYNDEQKIIEGAQITIMQTSYYQQLCQKEKDKLKTTLEKKNYQVYIEDDKVIPLTWQDAINRVVKPKELFDGMYNYFSLNTHPSIIAMMQFDQAFAKENPEYPSLCVTATRYVISFMSMFLQEYIKVSQKAASVFRGFDEDTKGVLTLHDYRI